MVARLKLTIAYDGAPFSGWQSQPNGNAIQDHLELAFERIVSEPVRVHGAGRTDAGVHALAQIAHADLPVRRYSPERWRSALNGVLPPGIRVMRCRFVSESFHARFSAKGKIYRYRIWNDDVAPPLENGRVWHVRDRLDQDGLTKAAKLFVGRHDFSAFAANRGSVVADTVRTVRQVRVRSSGSLTWIEVEGDGFLYKMVRMMVAALIQVGLGKASSDLIRARLAENDRSFALSRAVAPASGLFLIRVRY
jgi:tRNA pseudouridine38-40 synthase